MSQVVYHLHSPIAEIFIRKTSCILSLIILTELLTVVLWHLFVLGHSSLLCASHFHQNANIHSGMSDLLGDTVCFPCRFGLSSWSSCYLTPLTRVFNPCVRVFIYSSWFSTAVSYPESVWIQQAFPQLIVMYPKHQPIPQNLPFCDGLEITSY